MEAATVMSLTCEARADLVPDEFGFRPVPCAEDRGLRSLFDAAGTRHYYCATPGHRAAAIRRFGICPGCIDLAGPPHQPAAGCESGKRSHCSCEACF